MLTTTLEIDTKKDTHTNTFESGNNTVEIDRLHPMLLPPKPLRVCLGDFGTFFGQVACDHGSKVHIIGETSRHWTHWVVKMIPLLTTDDKIGPSNYTSSSSRHAVDERLH